MSFKEKLFKKLSYKDVDFFNEKSIGVILRGPSIEYLNLCSDKFNACFLGGEFNNNLDKIGGLLKGKDIVLSIVQSGRYRTPIEKCEEFNIKNIQVRYPIGSDSHNRMVTRFSDLNVCGHNGDHEEELKIIFTEREEGEDAY